VKRLWTSVWCALAFVPALCAGSETNAPVIGAYFISWGIYGRAYGVTNLPARQITHLFYAFAVPAYDGATDSGSLAADDAYAASVNFPALRKLKEEFPHLRTLISAGGWTGSDAFSDIMASSNERRPAR